MKEKVKNFIVFYQQQEIGERRRIRDEFLRESRMTYPAWYAQPLARYAGNVSKWYFGMT